MKKIASLEEQLFTFDNDHIGTGIKYILEALCLTMAKLIELEKCINDQDQTKKKRNIVNINEKKLQKQTITWDSEEKYKEVNRSTGKIPSIKDDIESMLTRLENFRESFEKSYQ